MPFHQRCAGGTLRIVKPLLLRHYNGMNIYMYIIILRLFNIFIQFEISLNATVNTTNSIENKQLLTMSTVGF